MDQDSGQISPISIDSNIEHDAIAMRREIELLKNLVKEDEWFNIPATLKSTIQGIIHFNKTVTTKLMTNAEISHHKVLATDERSKKLDLTTRTRIEH